MKITIEPTEDQTNRSPESRHVKVIIESDYDDMSYSNFAKMLYDASLAYGYTEQTVKEYINFE